VPEYLAPGVYVEETSFRAKSIEGTSTSTTAFVGLAVTGPSQDAPELLTSFGDFQRIYGGLDDLVVDSGGAVRLNHLAHAVRSYFDNGGGRLYAMRVVPDDATAATSPYLVGTGAVPAASARFVARFAGSGANGTIVARERRVAATDLSLRRAPVGSLLQSTATADEPAQITASGAGPFALTPGGQLHLTIDGADVSITFRAQPARVTGSALPASVDLAAADAADRVLNVTFGAGPAQAIQLGDQALAREALVGLINENLRGGYAALNGNSLVIGSDVRGLGAGITVVANEALGFDNTNRVFTPNPDPGQNNVQDIGAVTIDEIADILAAAGHAATATADEVTGDLVLASTELGGGASIAVRNVAGGMHDALGLTAPSSDTGSTGSATARYFVKTAAGAGRGTWAQANGTELQVSEGPGGDPSSAWQLLTLSLEASDLAGRTLLRDDLGYDGRHPQYVGSVFRQEPARRADALELGFYLEAGAQVTAFQLRQALVGGLADGESRRFALTGGIDGDAPTISSYQDAFGELGKLEDVSIVASPGYTAFWSEDAGDQALVRGVQEELIENASARRAYRIAVLDTPSFFTPTEARDWRSRIDSTYAAVYYPWVVVANPLARPGDSTQPAEITLPPSGSVCGIYARNDVTRGVHKAPANEVVRGGLRFERPISFGQQEMLNPIGVNCLRFFPGRGNRVWGARTASSDAEFKYVSDRRYFNYLESSIDRGSQFAVFEPNGDKLWRNVRDMISEFLYNEWRNGALFGKTPEEAFFVRCDRSTMTQNDLDNGRLICLIGVALLKPAEFVIFRIGQKTADARG
jgi:phage tail sheath protein FI